MLPSFFAVVDCTPDSFSDGGLYADTEVAIKRCKELYEQGAAYIDIGGEASGPGSVCIGPEEEWRRIEPVIKTLGNSLPLSVDTHEALVAERAIELGAKIINDVGGARSEDLLGVVAAGKVRYILMYSRCPKPHNFDYEAPKDILAEVRSELLAGIERALAAGILEENIIIDPGMGAFLSKKPEDSERIVAAASSLLEIGFPLLLGISRKRFLHALDSEADIDSLSARVAYTAWEHCNFNERLYFRVHSLQSHLDYFSEQEALRTVQNA